MSINRVVHGSHFWLIFGSFSTSFLNHFSKMNLKMKSKMNVKMIIFAKSNPSLAFAKMLIFTFLLTFSPLIFLISIQSLIDKFQENNRGDRKVSPKPPRVVFIHVLIAFSMSQCLNRDRTIKVTPR